MSSTLKLRVVRMLWFKGVCRAPGDILTMTPTEAASALETGRAELVDVSDAGEVTVARREDVVRQTRQQGRLMPDPGSPWRAVN